ncbi:heavy-metal-associated domain-containing protein [Nocardioides caldifontis]|uniref:heavy-metal-associated domain-containing protein n=1 Tax=Nocardioides caldifontis TaxID=2588938 RepID=UPI0013968431|nr:heavy-metal-associated domain-containing protein [Nocardioides caldifontis]
MTVLELFVPDMGCRRCVREVTARLRDVPGVQTVTVDAARSHVTLTGTMTAADALAALPGAGGHLTRLDAGDGVDGAAAASAAARSRARPGETDAEQAYG